MLTCTLLKIGMTRSKTNAFVEYPEHTFPNGQPKDFEESVYFNPTEIQQDRNPGVIFSWVQHFAQYFKKSWHPESGARSRRATTFEVNLVWHATSESEDTVGDVLSPSALAEMRTQEAEICAEIKRHTGVGVASGDIKSISRYIYADGYKNLAPALQEEAFINDQLDYAATTAGGARVGFPDSVGSVSLRLYGSNDMERTNGGAWRSQYIMTTLTIRQNPDTQGAHWIDFLMPYTLDKAKGKKYTLKDKTKLAGRGGPHTQFIFVGDQLSQTQLLSMLASDVFKAVIALSLIVAYMLIHTGSLFLTLIGLFNIIFAFPAGFWVYTGLFGKVSLPIMTPVTLIVCIGIAVDDVFVFIDTFKQTDQEGGLSKRLAKTFSSAASATLFTTITSAAAFAANTVSDIGALADFGLYTALVIVANYVILLLMLVSSLGFWWRYVAPWEAKVMIFCIGCFAYHFPGNTVDSDPEDAYDPDAPNSDAPAGTQNERSKKRPQRRGSKFIMSRIGADQRSDPLKVHAAPPDYVNPPDYSTEESPASRQEAYRHEADRYRSTLKARRRTQDNQLDTMGSIMDGDDIGAQIAGAGSGMEDELHGTSNNPEYTIMQRGLLAMGKFIAKFKYWVIVFYLIVCIVLFRQASKLQPSQEGPQLFVPDSNLGRGSSLVNTFSDFSATGGSGVDIPALSSSDASFADLLENPAAGELDGVTMTCDLQFKSEDSESSSIGGANVPFLNCPTGTERVLASVDCAGKICTAAECCETTRSCQDYIAGIDSTLCSAAGMLSKVSGGAADATCVSPGGCEASDCCISNKCNVFFQNNPAQAMAGALCTGKTHADTTSIASCANAATCTSSECCAENPTCGASGFLLSSCPTGTHHLKDSQNLVQCAGKSCVSSDCCEANQQCQAFFNANAGVCQNSGKVEEVGTTTCTVDPCTSSECCKNQNCATFENQNSICTGNTHLKDSAASIFGLEIEMTKAKCCEANPVCPSGPSSVVCAAKNHLKPNPTAIQCPTDTCTSAVCCETNEVCSSAAHSSICATADKNYDAGETGSVCDGESCTDEDCCVPNCAEASITCGSGAFNPSKSASLRAITKCAAEPCTVNECCLANPTCSTFSNGNCASGTSLTANPGALTCQGQTCTSDDCCVDYPTCNSYACTNAGTINYGDKRSCSSSTCSASDCCKPLTCDSIADLNAHCGASKVPEPGSTACPGFSCGNCPDTDSDSLNGCADCCSEQTNPKCKDWISDNPSFCGVGKVGVDDNTRCSGQCTGADISSCCVVVSYPTCNSISGTFCSEKVLAVKPNGDQITCSATQCSQSDCCEPYKTCADELSSTPAFCSAGQNLAEDNLNNLACNAGPCSTTFCCRSRTCGDSGAPSCSAGTHIETANVCILASSCTQSECCEPNPTCESASASICSTGKMLMQGDRSSTTCAGQTCIESDCCVDEPSEVPLELVFDCTGKSDEEIAQAIVELKQQVAVDTGLLTSDFTIELCNREARKRRAGGGGSDADVPAVRGRVWHLDGTRSSREAVSRSRRETTTMIIKLDSSLSPSDLSGARDVLVNEEDNNPGPLDILKVDPDTGDFVISGNLSWTVTTTKATTTAPLLPTEQIILRPSRTRFAIGLAAPYVQKNVNADEFADGLLRVIPLTGNVQDERPIFDLNFNHDPGEGFVTLNDVAVIASGDPNILSGTELASFANAKIQKNMTVAMLLMCERIADSVGLVNPGQKNTSCALQNLEIAIRYVQPNCEVLDAMEQQKKLDASSPSGWTTCSGNPSVAYCGDFSTMVAMIAFTFENRFSSSSLNSEKVAQYEALEGLLVQLRAEFPKYDIRQANVEYGTAINEVLAVSGAVWGVIISLVLVFVAVVLFKANGRLTLIVGIMIIANLGSVVGIFHLCGWVLGGIEAVALSILIGTGVDYCIHMVEGFLETHPEHMEGRAKAKLERQLEGLDENAQRDVRVYVAVAHIGVPVLSAAITTGVCGLVLSFCELMMFKRFGEIILMNTVSSIVLTLTFLPALLAALGPKSYHHTAKASVIGLLLLCLVGGGVALILFFVAKGGTCIPGPSGKYLFTSPKCSPQY